MPNRKKPKPKEQPKWKKYLLDFLFLYLEAVPCFNIKIKNNKDEKEKKFKNVKLNGAKLSTVIAPNKNGAKYITKYLFFNKFLKAIF